MTDLEPGQLARIAPGVHRLLAPNASMMTGPGTNTYLLGDPPIAVIDPGPNDAAHITAICEAAPGLQQIFCTHTHSDHSSAARAVAKATGAKLVGRGSPRDGRQDLTFQPELEPVRDQRFTVGNVTLRAIDTPGHASNHVCYLLEEERLLFSGDHVLDGMTPVIIPPDGNMSAYIESLRRLKTYEPLAIAPGHGRVLNEAISVIDAVIAHRLKREAKVAAALTAAGRATVGELLPHVYDDVHPALHALARLSLEAHLIKLEQEGFCAREGDSWQAHSSKSG